MTEVELALANGFAKPLVGFAGEWELATEQHVEDHTQTPDVTLPAIPRFGEDFRGHVVRGTGEERWREAERGARGKGGVRHRIQYKY